MEAVYPPILKLAYEKKIPIIDLANTYDIYDDEIYVSQIEPSEKGGLITAQLINHVIKNHDFTQPSALYKMKLGNKNNNNGEITTESNNNGEIIKTYNDFHITNKPWIIGEVRQRTPLIVMLEMMKTTLLVTNSCKKKKEKSPEEIQKEEEEENERNRIDSEDRTK